MRFYGRLTKGPLLQSMFRSNNENPKKARETAGVFQMATTPRTLEMALEDSLKDLYSAEKQLMVALPKMAKAASNPTLRQAFLDHLEETKGHVARIEKATQLIDAKPSGKKCKAMEGLIEEGKEVLEFKQKSAVIDALLIGAAQRVEHYEIAAYGTARALAERTGNSDVVELLQQTLDEEGACDKKLTDIAESEVLAEAAEGAEEEDEEE